jgi:uncharacterized protein YecT (DUF1311 family)
MKNSLFFLLLVSFQIHASGLCNKVVTTADMLECADDEFSAADKKLNITYGNLLKTLDAEGQRKLKDAQRVWIKFRDLNADFAGDSMRGGSAEPLVIIGERTQMTAERTKQLQYRLDLPR